MRILTLILGSLLVTLISTKVTAAPMCAPKRGLASEHTCVIRTGYGQAIGRGPSEIAAKEEARVNCGSGLIDQYSGQRADIPESAIDYLTLACVNLECEN